MSQVDSSVGGKTGVNHPLGKNMVGAFYQPTAVLIDTATLRSLPNRELASGISEIVKYGLIRDAELFVWLEANIERLMERDSQVAAATLRPQPLKKFIVFEPGGAVGIQTSSACCKRPSGCRPHSMPGQITTYFCLFAREEGGAPFEPTCA